MKYILEENSFLSVRISAPELRNMIT